MDQPTSLMDCIQDDGSIDFEMLWMYSQYMDSEYDELLDLIFDMPKK